MIRFTSENKHMSCEPLKNLQLSTSSRRFEQWTSPFICGKFFQNSSKCFWMTRFRRLFAIVPVPESWEFNLNDFTIELSKMFSQPVRWSLNRWFQLIWIKNKNWRRNLTRKNVLLLDRCCCCMGLYWYVDFPFCSPSKSARLLEWKDQRRREVILWFPCNDALNRSEKCLVTTNCPCRRWWCVYNHLIRPMSRVSVRQSLNYLVVARKRLHGSDDASIWAM